MSLQIMSCTVLLLSLSSKEKCSKHFGGTCSFNCNFLPCKNQALMLVAISASWVARADMIRADMISIQ